MKARIFDYGINNKLIISSDVDFPPEENRTDKEQNQANEDIFLADPLVDELDCVFVDPLQHYEAEKIFPGTAHSEVRADHTDIADKNVPASQEKPVRDFVSDPRPVRNRQAPKRLRDEQAEALKESSLLSTNQPDIINPPLHLPERYCHFIVPDPSILASYIAAQNTPHPLAGTPFTHAQAMSSPDADCWKRAEEAEVSGLIEKDTWTVVERPPSHVKVLSGKFVYRKKMNLDGSIKKYKARYIVRGFEQRFGQDYTDTWASVIKSNSYKVLMAKVAAKDLELEQMDVVMAYPHGRLAKDETIYVELPPGYFTDGDDCVALLNSALYGLKQGARVWYLTLYAALIKLGFKRTYSDHSLFTHPNGIIIGVYVDDLLIAGPSITDINKLKKELMSQFDMMILVLADTIWA